MEPVVVIVGPTCSGKTFLSLKLAETLNTEIISADSRQVFKLLNIGTAKPSEDELRKIKHYFIDSLEPNMEFNASDFEVSAIEVIKKLHLRKKIPIVTGGSGLYVKALIDGIIDIEGTDSSLRLVLMKERERYGDDFMYNKLVALDPISA
ncbi:MAG TPA: tRNA (adenosine(37)-N6)-dimethylallyltransferase MiaA, partial [Ignavibacteriaceae bacterium]|nr:tRNA (adenosine(37)-N6)-dimethylallyltransferase MiaA [Ignavibacteriaceae bacterium]